MNARDFEREEKAVAALWLRPTAYLIAVAGIPGAGKTTFAARLAQRIENAVVLPMDGYHIPRARLDPEGMARRGARHTFDDAALRADLTRLRRERHGAFPAFDHAEQDPRPAAIQVSAETPIVIVEGLYLLMSAWQLAPLFDLTIFLDCDLEIALFRVATRHHECGLVETIEAGRARAESNDRRNALDVLGDGCRERADLVL